MPDRRTWNKLGEPGEHRGHEKDGKYQPDELKHSIYDSKHSFCDSKRSICQPYDSKQSISRHL